MWEKLWEINGQKYELKGDEHYKQGLLKQARLDYLKAQEIYSIHQVENKDLDERIAAINLKLAEEHQEKAKELEKQEAFTEALEELKFLQFLLEDGKKKDKVIQKIEELSKKLSNQETDNAAKRFFERGKSFLAEGSKNEALVEFKEALKFENLSQEFKNEIIECASEIETEFAQMYIKKAEKYVSKEKPHLAVKEYERALSFLEYNESLRKKIVKEINKYDKDSLNKEVSDGEWEEAYQEFRDSLSDYLGFDFMPTSNLIPPAGNLKWADYIKAKKKLGEVYLKKAQKFYDGDQLNLALKLYHEAASYFETKDEQSKKIKSMIKEIKSKLK